MENKLRLLVFFLLLSFIPKGKAQQIPSSAGSVLCSTCVPNAGWVAVTGTPDVSNATTAATSGTLGGGNNWNPGPLPAPPNGHSFWISIRDVGTLGSEEAIRTTMSDLFPGREYELTIYTSSAITGGATPYAGQYIDQFDFQVGARSRINVSDVSQNIWGTNKLRFTAEAATETLTFYPGNNSGASSAANFETVNISVTLNAINSIPVAEDKNATTPIGVPVDVDAVEGAIDYDGNIVPGSVDLDPDTDGQQTSVTTPEGTWTANPDGIVTFTPAPGFSGEATLTYTVEDDYALDGVSAPGVSTPKTITVFVENPAFSLVKVLTSVNADAAAVEYGALGDLLAYTITVTNTGNVTLSDIEVNDALTGLNETIATLAPGANEVLTTTYTINQGDLDNGSVLNKVIAEGEGPGGDPVNPENPGDGEVTTPGSQNPSLRLVKAADFTGPLGLNDVITYTFNLSNEGNVTITNIAVTDPLLGGPIANTSTAAGSSWPSAPGTLAPGESVILMGNYSVTAADIANGLIENTATVNGDGPTNPLPPQLSNEVIVSVVDNCDPASGNVDTDGDGIADICDLDDDNDGILDTDECSFIPSPLIIANTNGGELVEYNTVTNNLTVLCSGITVTGGIVGDIAMDSDGNIWGITSTNKLIRVDPSSCAVTEVVPDLGFSGNGLSFLPDGNLLAGGAGNATVRKIDVVGGTYQVSTWADFGTGFSNGDFICFGDKVYVLWFDAGIDPTNPLILEVAVDADFDYLSHTVLGALPRYTWGLAKANGDQLFGVTGVGADGAQGPIGTIVRINTQAPFSWTPIFSYPQLFYGATSVDEMALECDTDEDGIPNRLDPDSDNDGCPDAVEYYGVIDPIGNEVNADGTVVGASYTGNYTNAITATQLAISTQPVDVTAVGGSAAVFSATAEAIQATTFDGGLPDYTEPTAIDVSAGLIYQWQESVDGGDTWNDISDGGQYSGTTTDELTIDNIELEQKDNQYRLVITHDMHVCPVMSTAALLNVPSLSFTKTGALSADGNTVTYTFTVTNTGDVTMEDITIDDPKITSPIVLEATMLAPGGSTTGTATYTLTQAEKDAGEVENAATVTGTPPTTDPSDPAEPIEPIPSTPDVDNPGTPGDPGVPTIVDVPAGPSLSFAKTGVLSADGNTIEYTFTVTNTGNVTMEDITLAEADFSGTGTAPVPVFASNSGSSPEGTLIPGEVATYTATYTLTQADKDAGGVENAATVTGTPPFDPTDPTQPGEPIDPVPSTPDVDNPGVPTVVDVPADPSLSFAKTGVLSADGNTITYTFTVTNTGNVTMMGVEVTDPKITGAIVLGATTLAPGESTTGTTTYTVTQAEKDAGKVENQATVTGTPPTTDPDNPAAPMTPVPSTPNTDQPGTPGDPGIPTVVDVPAAPALSFAKMGVLSTDGNTVTYTFAVTNTGNVTMEDITLAEAGFSGTGTAPAPAFVSNSGTSVEGTLAPGEIATYTATYTLTQVDKDAGEVENNATVTGTPPTTDPDNPAEPIDPVPSTPDVDNPGTPGNPGVPTEVEIPADPALSFAKTGVLFAEGNTIEYTFTVTNTGNVTLTDITVDDPKITGAITFDVTELAPGEVAMGTATYTVTQAEKDAGEVENLATVTGTPPTTDPDNPAEPIEPVPSTPDPDNPGTPGDPGVPTLVDVPADPALSFAKTGVLFAEGNTIEYTFTVTNTGNVTLTGVEVTDPKITDPIVLAATTLVPGESTTGTATYTVTQAEKDAGEVENAATVTGTPPFNPDDPTQPGEPIDPVPSTPDVDDPGTPGDPGVPTVVEVPAGPALSFAKTGVLSADGNSIEYTFTVTNTGNVTMTGVTVTDPKITGTITLDETTLAPGEVATGTATYTITQAEKDAGEVENLATATGTPPTTDPDNPADPINPVPSTPDPDNPGTPGDPGVPTTTNVPLAPSLTLTKVAIGEGPYAINDDIEYEIVIRNTGNVTLKDIVITDDNAEIVSGSPVASLAPNTTATVVARHQITQADIDAAIVVNQAKVTGNDPGGNPIPEVPSNNPDTPQPNDPTVVELTQRPGLALTKRAIGEGPYGVDDYIDYEIVIRNTGNVTLTSVTVTDNNAEITDGSPVASLAPNATATVIARHQVTQTDIDAGTVVNQATATGNNPEGNAIPEVLSDNPDTPQPNDPTVVELTQKPGLSLTKRITGEGPYTIGQYINYELTVTNTGNVTLTDVVVTDNNAAIVSGSPVANLAPSAMATVIARHQVTQADIDAGTVVNQAKATGDDPDGDSIPEVPSDNPDTPQPNDPTVVELTQSPSLALTKRATGEGPYALGQYINYELIVTNTGNVTLTDVTVTDNNAEITAGSPIASLAPNTATTVIARHRVTQADIDAGTVVNQAKVTGDDPDGNPIAEVPSDNPDTPQPNDPTVVELTQRPGLALNKRATGEGPYTVGDYIDFEITVTNTGNVTLTDVAVTDSNAEIVSGSPVASLAPNKATTVIARHQVTQADIDAGRVVNQAKVTGDDPDGNPIAEVPSDNPDTPQPNDPTVVELTQRPALVLAKRATGEGPYTVGDYIDFEITVTNTGNVTLTDVAVTDSNAEIVSGSPVASLAPNKAATVIVRHQVTQADIDGGMVVNQAKVTGDDPDGNPIVEVPSDNPDTPQPNDPTVVELAQQPSLVLTKRVTGEGPYAVNQYINYEIAVRNTGNVTLTDVTVTDDNAEITAGSPIANLAPNTTVTVIARHQVTQADIDAGTVVNQAKVTGDDPDGNPIPEVPSDNPDTPQPNDPTVVELTQRPGLALTKRSTGEGPYAVGDYIDYEITVRNTGNVTLTDVTVTDNNAEIIAGSPIASLLPGARATVVARHPVTQADIDAGTVVNQATATANDPDGTPIPEVLSDDPNTSEPNDPTVIYMESRPGLSLTKGVTSEGPYGVGDQIKYFNIVVTNTGNVTLTDVVVTDDNAEILAGSPIARLRPGESVTVTARHVVTQADVDAGEVINQARVSGNDPGGNRTPEFLSDDPNTPEPGDKTITAIAQAPAIRIDKVADRELVEKAGDRIGYQLQVINTGNVTLHDVEITDPLTGFIQQIARIRPGIINAHTFRTTYVTTAADLVVGKIVNTAMVMAVAPNGSEVNHAATVEVEAYLKEIEVENDDFGPVNGRTGGNVGNVFTNDKVNGSPLVPEEVILTRVPSDDPLPLALEEDGMVTVAPNTPAGMYSFDYQVCDIINPSNCEVATVTVVVAPAEIKAVGDQVTGVNGYQGTSNVANVFANDQLNGAPIVPEEVTLTLVSNDPALQLNPDGSVDVVPGTRGGTYTLTYQICEKLNPDNCSVATVTVTVVNPLKIPNVFTPNGDGRNDQFEIIGSEGFDRIEVTIINRWGSEVYRNKDYKNDWAGEGLTEGTYYYLITTHLGSTKEVHKGWVLIKRL
ncbi:gliding motility-associated C-terminal domain-containing protein [Parapedobacter sp. 2B3]|uniref:DUF7507 domain-containing protein n=1 Tax=Parapedobacter sp. 2B3 TaxID=3342381 RepID=UPI0035B633F4